MSSTDQYVSDAAILSGIINAHGDGLSQEAAQSLLAFNFSPEQHARMHELLERNSAAALTEQEREELESFARVGSFLALLHSKARLVLSGRPA